MTQRYGNKVCTSCKKSHGPLFLKLFSSWALAGECVHPQFPHCRDRVARYGVIISDSRSPSSGIFSFGLLLVRLWLTIQPHVPHCSIVERNRTVCHIQSGLTPAHLPIGLVILLGACGRLGQSHLPHCRNAIPLSIERPRSGVFSTEILAGVFIEAA